MANQRDQLRDTTLVIAILERRINFTAILKRRINFKLRDGSSQFHREHFYNIP